MKKFLSFITLGLAGVALVYVDGQNIGMSNVSDFDFAVEVAEVEEELLERFSEQEIVVASEVAQVVELPQKKELKILAFGDMMLGRYVRTLMDRHGKDYIFEDIYKDGWFWDADIVHANLEGPIKGKGKKGGTSMNFSFNEDVAPLLKRYGFDVLSIANNHALDQGQDGRRTTIEALEGAGLGWCGHPSDAAADSVYYGQVEEASYAFVCLEDITSRVDIEDAVDLIWSVKRKVDFAIVSVHWGYEYKHTADKWRQVNMARSFVDAGADFVIGHHPHVVQNFEEYNGRLIFYSLGNFVFDQYWSRKTQEGLSIGISLEDGDEGFKSRVQLFPMKSSLSKSRLMTETEKSEWLERFLGYGTYDSNVQENVRQGFVELSSER